MLNSNTIPGTARKGMHVRDTIFQAQRGGTGGGFHVFKIENNSWTFLASLFSKNST